MKNEKSKMQKRSLSEDERGVSPVVGVIMMVAITVVIAAVVAAFAYGIIGGVTKAPNTALVVEGAVDSEDNVTIIHYGGDKIIKAFSSCSAGNTSDCWNNLQVRINGNESFGAANVKLNNVTIAADEHFEPGDELKIDLTTPLSTADSLTVVYVPTGDVLQRVVVT